MSLSVTAGHSRSLRSERKFDELFAKQRDPRRRCTSQCQDRGERGGNYRSSSDRWAHWSVMNNNKKEKQLNEFGQKSFSLVKSILTIDKCDQLTIEQVNLPDAKVNHDHQGGSFEVRPRHCTPAVRWPSRMLRILEYSCVKFLAGGETAFAQSLDRTI